MVTRPERLGGDRERAAMGVSGYAWYTLILLTVVYLLNFIDRQMLNILIEPIKIDLGATDTQMGVLSGFVFALFYTFFGIPLGRAADVWDRRYIIALGLAAWSAMTALTGLASNYGQLVGTRIGVAVGEASCTPSAFSIIADYFPPRRRATALAIYSMGIYVGAGVGLFLGGFLAERFSWRTAFIAAGLPGIGLAVWVATLREPMRGATEPVAAERRHRGVTSVLRYLVGTPSLIFHHLGFSFLALSGYAGGTWLPAFFVRIHGQPLSRVGLLIGIISSSGGIIGAFSGGWMADRWTARDARARLFIGTLVGVLGFPLMFATLYAPSVTLAWMFALPLTIIGAAWLGPAAAVIQDLVLPDMRALSSAIYLFVVNLIGLGLGPVAVGWLTDLAGDPRAIRQSLLIVSGVAGTSAAILLILSSRYIARDMKAKASRLA